MHDKQACVAAECQSSTDFVIAGKGSKAESKRDGPNALKSLGSAKHQLPKQPW